jgi:hypothetical protein
MFTSRCRNVGESSNYKYDQYKFSEEQKRCSNSAYPCRMFIGLQSKVKHLASLIALLVHQLVADGQKTRKACLHDPVKLCPVVAIGRLVTEGAANSEQAL